MKPSLIFFSLTAIALFPLAYAAAQEPAAPNHVLQSNRGAAAARLSERVKQLQERLEEIDPRPAAQLGIQRDLQAMKELLTKIEADVKELHFAPPRLLFPIGIERAIMGEAVPRNGSHSQRDNGLFDDKKGGPGRFGPAIPPRK